MNEGNEFSLENKFNKKIYNSNRLHTKNSNNLLPLSGKIKK